MSVECKQTSRPESKFELNQFAWMKEAAEKCIKSDSHINAINQNTGQQSKYRSFCN